MAEEVIAINKAVYLTYSIIDQSGKVYELYDSLIGYVHGYKSGLIEKVERSLEGCKAGDRIEVMLNPTEGFGEHNPDHVFSEDIENVPPEFHYVGAEIEFITEHGRMICRVSHIADGKVTVDANHPLAGQTVSFIVNVKNIRDATPDEIASGQTADVENSSEGSRIKMWAKSISEFFSRISS